jgi:hypothetical protein
MKFNFKHEKIANLTIAELNRINKKRVPSAK